jgi:hypothetical protein
MGLHGLLRDSLTFYLQNMFMRTLMNTLVHIYFLYDHSGLNPDLFIDTEVIL